MAQTNHVLFFSRGKGRGHAVPDAAIARELTALDPLTEIDFVSYSVGATTLRDLGWDVTDLGLPEDPPIWDAAKRAVEILRERQPDLVVSHEEFCAVPISKAFGFRTVFLTDWFGDAAWPIMQGLRHADEVLFMDEPGYADVPPYVRDKICYTGIVFRPLDKVDPLKARLAMGIPPEATVFMVAPGGSAMHTEERTPVFNLIVQAFDRLPFRAKRLLYVVGGPDHQLALLAAAGRTDIMILKPHETFTSTIMASNLVITTGNRTPILECEALGRSDPLAFSGPQPLRRPEDRPYSYEHSASGSGPHSCHP